MTGIGVIGAGHWGPHLIRNFNDHLSSQVLWVSDMDEKHRKAVSERFPGVGVTDRLDDLFGDE
ncbi:MAG TPA: gfo/Idh/MocA family oxidoreductase, partial [Acidimicrobiia bacterium]|nr:gfo/Idh/MocA family oxidoreductase [Acidimicrobiia bacterium]